MVNQFDRRNDPEAQRLFERLRLGQHKPLVGAADLQEIVKVMDALPELEFPIHSAGELIEKLGGSERTLEIAEVPVNSVRMLKYMPAYYFPISSIENFVEKMAELIRANRKRIDIPKELTDVKRQLPRMRFPIANADELFQALGSKESYRFQGNKANTREMIRRIPEGLFPIESQDDFDDKISQLMATRPLIAKD